MISREHADFLAIIVFRFAAQVVDRNLRMRKFWLVGVHSRHIDSVNEKLINVINLIIRM